MYNVHEIRKDFPILDIDVNGKPLVYLDSAASAQKPKRVIDAVNRAYSSEYANVHRGLHHLSSLATEKYEEVREKIKELLNAEHDDEILYTTGTTEGINLVAYSWAMPRMAEGDEIVLTAMEHHANIVPWHFLRERQGISLVWVEPDKSGYLDSGKIIERIGPKTKLVAVTHMSNVLGTKVDIRTICNAAHEHGVPVLADGSQAAVHGPVDVRELGVDFYPITGHKLYGPTASGAIYIRRQRLVEMQPFMGGGDMIREVTRDNVAYAQPPLKFESGTPPIVQMIGLGEALDYISSVGMDKIADYEAELRDYASCRLSEKNWLMVQGETLSKGAIFSFNLVGPAHPHDVSTVLDQQGIAVRAGHHCAQPLMDFYGITASCRASFAMYSTREEVDKLIEGLEVCYGLFA